MIAKMMLKAHLPVGHPSPSVGEPCIPQGAGKITVPGKASIAGPGSWGSGARTRIRPARRRSGAGTRRHPAAEEPLPARAAPPCCRPVAVPELPAPPPCRGAFLSPFIAVWFRSFELRHTRARRRLHCPICVFAAFLAQQTGCVQICQPGLGYGGFSCCFSLLQSALRLAALPSPAF